MICNDNVMQCNVMLGMSCLLHSVLSSCINHCTVPGVLGWCSGMVQTPRSPRQLRQISDLDHWTRWGGRSGPHWHDLGHHSMSMSAFFPISPGWSREDYISPAQYFGMRTLCILPLSYASFPCHVATVATVPVFTRSFGLEVSTFYTPNFQNSAPRPRNAGIGSSGCPTCDPGIPPWRVRWCGDAAELHEPCEGDCGDPAFRNGPWREA